MRKTILPVALFTLATFGGCVAELDQSDPGLDLEAVVEPSVAESAQALSSSSGYTTVAWEELPGDTNSIVHLAVNLWMLQGRNIAVALHWPTDKFGDSLRWSLVHYAQAIGVPIYPWITLPQAVGAEQNPSHARYAKTGYFPNSTNYAEWISQAQQFMFLWRSAGLAPTTLIVDLEMRKEKLLEFGGLVDNGNVAGAVELLRDNTNRTRQSAAISAFREFADYAHGRGFKLAVSTLLPMLEDYTDGDDSLRQGFTVPLENNPLSSSAIQWDSVSFQAQRSYYRKSYPNLSPYFVYDYGRIAVRYFGSKAGLDLGLTHKGIAPDGTGLLYTGPDELRQDTGAAARAGIPRDRIGVYSFRGIVEAPDPVRWLDPPISYSPPLFGDSVSATLTLSLQTLDFLLVN